jgi:hypothetical protein
MDETILLRLRKVPPLLLTEEDPILRCLEE